MPRIGHPRSRSFRSGGLELGAKARHQFQQEFLGKEIIHVGIGKGMKTGREVKKAVLLPFQH